VTAEHGWQREFEDPIPVPKGKPLITLKDAATRAPGGSGGVNLGPPISKRLALAYGGKR